MYIEKCITQSLQKYFFHTLKVKIIFSLHIDPYEAAALSFSCILACFIFASQRITPRVP